MHRTLAVMKKNADMFAGALTASTVAITNGTKIFYIDETAGVIVVLEQ